ncbi:MAG TPA: MBL fold metallo-hydrolase [Lacunisphaera sp.]|nr:MBL fold metallo-hydrolase [Lacunisphaera sp.]
MPRTLLVLGLVAILAGIAPAGENTTRWTMLNVTPRDDVADCHLLELPDHIKVLIDAGKLGDSPGAVLAELQARRINSLDLVVISHLHIDHYGALVELVENGIKIKRVALTVPTKSLADREKPWGCDLDHVHRTLESLTANGIPFFTPTVGECLLEATAADGSRVCLEVLAAYNGDNSPIELQDVNDTSIVVRLSHGPTRVLFTGDLNHPLGSYLAGRGIDLHADVLKAPHHGTESTVPNEFYDRVGAKAVLVSSPKNLWQSARSMRTRNYFLTQKVPTYVSGINGSVTVTLTSHGYRVESER